MTISAELLVSILYWPCVFLRTRLLPKTRFNFDQSIITKLCASNVSGEHLVDVIDILEESHITCGL